MEMRESADETDMTGEEREARWLRAQGFRECDVERNRGVLAWFATLVAVSKEKPKEAK